MFVAVPRAFVSYCLPFCLAIRYRIWGWWKAGHRWHRVCVNTNTAGIHPTCICEKGGSKFWWQTLPCSVFWRRGLFLGRGGRWKTGPRKQKVQFNCTLQMCSNILNTLATYRTLQTSSSSYEVLTQRSINVILLVGSGNLVARGSSTSHGHPGTWGN